MNDLESLLRRAARPGAPGPVPDSVVDDDINRGRRALVRQRIRRGGARTLLAGALLAGGYSVVDAQTGGAGTDRTAGSPMPGVAELAGEEPGTDGSEPKVGLATPTVGTQPAIQLVSYTGEQPAGFTVGSVPQGWELQGADAYSLLIARQGDPDTDIHSFDGKLVVMLQSKDEDAWTAGAEVIVGASTGLIDRDPERNGPGNARLFFQDAAGHRLVVQVPAALGWSDAQIAQFGTTVQANANAAAGVG